MDGEKVIFPFDFEKAAAALAYLAAQNEEVPELDKFKAAKLLFLAEKYHLVRYARPIFGGEYRALPYGPVPQTILDYIHKLVESEPSGVEDSDMAWLRTHLRVDRRFLYPRILPNGVPDLSVLSESEIAALNHVIKLHGTKSFAELKAITHSTFAYRNAWDSRPQGQNTAPMDYEDFFEEDADAIAGAFEEMIENFQIRRALGEFEQV